MFRSEKIVPKISFASSWALSFAGRARVADTSDVFKEVNMLVPAELVVGRAVELLKWLWACWCQSFEYMHSAASTG